MTFSASPLVPGQQVPGQDDPWARAAGQVTAAVAEALGQVPSATPLTPGQPVADAASVALPDPAGAAVTGYLGGGAEGKVLIVVGQELVDALSGTPFGTVEPAQALKPALETVATALGGRLDGDTTGIAVEDCLEVLAGGTTVLVPLLASGTVAALIGVTLNVVPASAPTSQSAGTASAAGQAVGLAGPGAAGGSSWGIDMLRDVEMEITCELGRTRMSVRQLLALAPGDVVELDRLAGAPADLLVNGTLLARGEVVVVDESFGLRITEIVTQDAT
jgi:flagellar motor switch protein FliN/FliY